MNLIAVMLTAGMLTHVFCPSANAAFTKIADTLTAIPNGGGNFTDFGNVAAIDGGSIVFQASGASNQQGIYFWNGSNLVRIADKGTSVPNGSGTFSFFSFFGYTVLNNKVMFQAAGSNGENGIYAWENGVLSKVIDHTDTIPGTSDNFTSFRQPVQDGNAIAFIAFGPNSYGGVFVLENSTLTKIVDTNMAFPGGVGNMIFSSEVSFVNGDLAFWAGDQGNQTGSGIFVYKNSTLTKIIQSGDAAPGTGQTLFTANSPPAIDGNKVVFPVTLGTDFSTAILQASLDGSGLETVLDNSMSIPSGSGNFTGFGGFASENGTLVYVGQGSGTPLSGLYKREGGSDTKIIDLTEMIDGRSFQSTQAAIRLTPHSLHNGELAIITLMDSGVRGIYTTTVGGPTGSGALSSMTATYNDTTGFSVEFTGEVGVEYEVQYSTEPQGGWTRLMTFTYSTPVSVTDSGAAKKQKRFYRTITPPAVSPAD